MNGIDFSIVSEVAEIENELRKLHIYVPNISKKILKKITSKQKSKLRTAYRQSGLKTTSNALYKSIYGTAKNNFTGYAGIASKQAYKFIPLNYGMEIRAKDKYLTFQVNGEWVKVRSVHIPARNFFEVGARYMDSQEMKRDIEVILKREVDKALKV